MKNELVLYYKYLISNMINQCSYLEKFGINQSEENILKTLEEMKDCTNKIYDQMELMGIDVQEISSESYDLVSNLRDFKIKRLLQDERS